MYNDLKLDNIMIPFGNKVCLQDHDCFKDVDICLIDFGFASKYIDKESGDCLPKKAVSSFCGNIWFASQAQLDFYSTFPRDDLISLAFLMIYLIRGGSLPKINLNNDENLNIIEFFQYVKDIKL